MSPEERQQYTDYLELNRKEMSFNEICLCLLELYKKGIQDYDNLTKKKVEAIFWEFDEHLGAYPSGMQHLSAIADGTLQDEAVIEHEIQMVMTKIHELQDKESQIRNYLERHKQ